MAVSSRQAQLIQSYVESHSESKIGSKLKLVISGRTQHLDVYKIPMNYLRFNADNGRIRMEVKEWEHNSKGIKLDSSKLDDAKIIQKMLLEQSTSDSEFLAEDLKKYGQLQAGVITHDGVVINANRRMAVIQKLHDEVSTGRWSYLEVAILPTDVAKMDLWRIEASLQLAKDTKVDYGPINALLKVREGLEAELSTKEIAAVMSGYSEDDIKLMLARLELIDTFLDFMGNSNRGNYGLIRKFGLHEYFINIQNAIVKPAKKLGLKRRDLEKRLMCTFALIRASVNRKGEDNGITHMDIRKLKNIFEDAHATGAFLKNLGVVDDVKSVDEEVVIDDFRNANDICNLRREESKPLKLITRATNAIRSINQEKVQYREVAVRLHLGKLKELVDEMWDDLNTSD